MVLSDIEGWVRGKLSDDSFPTSLIDPAANWFVNSIFNDHAIRKMETNDQISGNAGDTEIDLPSDIQTMLKEGLAVISPQIYHLSDYFMEYGDFMKSFPNFASATPAALTRWTDFSNTIRPAAPLLTDTTINIDYLRLPVQMVNPTDECEIDDAYQEMVVLGTLARCMQTNEDYPEAAQELANLAPLITAFVAQEGRGQLKSGPTVIRSNRRGGNTKERGW